MEPLLPDQFFPADKVAWRTQVQKDLKDTSAPDSLRWITPEGFTADPYYTAEDLTALPLNRSQATRKSSSGWLNAPACHLTGDPKADNLMLRDTLARGADALVLTLPAQPDILRLLDGIKLSDTPVFFRVQGDTVDFLKRLRQVAPYQLRGGMLPNSESIPYKLESLTLTADSPNFRPIGASSHTYHNAGATATQELAFLLGALADQYDSLTDAGVSADQLIPKTMLSLSVGTSYFIEIAKLRALRVLWQRFTAAYQPAQPATPAFIHAQTSVFYKTIQSPYTNLLRATTEAMAAVIGGCDVLTVLPYRTVIASSAETSAGDKRAQDHADRVARNVSILLKEESYLDKVADPSAGSYYIETLTHELTEAAWTLFLRVETMGGLAKATDFVRAEIDAAFQAKVAALKNGRVMVGVNKFQESLPDSPKPAIQEEDTVFLPVHRLAQAFEN